MRDITLCHPRLQLLAGQLVDECNKQGLKIKISETLRTVAEQDALYARVELRQGILSLMLLAVATAPIISGERLLIYSAMMELGPITKLVAFLTTWVLLVYLLVLSGEEIGSLL